MEAVTGVTGTVTEPKGARQFQGLFKVIPFVVNIDEDSIAASAAAHGDVTVTGAELGDFVLIAPTIDPVSVNITAYVSAANTVTVFLQNLEVSDANTTFAGNTKFNGLVLQQQENIINWGP